MEVEQANITVSTAKAQIYPWGLSKDKKRPVRKKVKTIIIKGGKVFVIQKVDYITIAS